MKINKPLFILAGNGSYNNRGCEAIVRGTVKILRHYFNDPRFSVLSYYLSNEEFENQKLKEFDKDIIHKKAFIFGRFKPARFLKKIGLLSLNQEWRSRFIYKEIIPDFGKSCAVLSVGGDNYSFDYGKPTFFVDLDNLVLSKNKPIIIWAASIGPFSRDLKYENYIKEHFKKITGIFVRDPITMDYLADIGIAKNVYRVADPAFLLDAVEPSDNKFDKKKLDGAIGINLSPLMANFIPNSNLKKWTKESAKIVKKILIRNKKPICLIPHVTSLHTNDYEFLKKVLFLIDGPKDMINLIPDDLNAAETKWVISKMSVFAGARMHSVISALSSGVPALSLAYSIKAQGISRDIYGNDYFSINQEELTPDILAEKINELIEEQTAIKEQINLSLPRIKKLAMDAGKYLKDIIDL